MALSPHLADLEQRLADRLAEAVAEFRRAAEAELRRESDRALGALAEIPAPSVAGWLGEDAVAALELAPRREAARETLARLLDALRALDAARSQAAALDALLDGALGWSDRVALVLAREEGLAVWGDRGFGDESLAGRELDWDEGLRERLLATRGCVRLDADAAGDVLGRFGAAGRGAAAVVPLVLRDRVAALLWADGERAPELAALQVLVHAAGQRLELQALSERAFSPTLWEGATAPGEPLPLWSSLAPAPAEGPEDAAAPAPAEEPAAAAAESDDSLWREAAAEAPPAPVAEAPAAPVDESAELAIASEPAESARELGEALPPEIELPLAPAEEPQPAFELVSAEPEPADAGEIWEPAPEVEEEAEAPAPEPDAVADAPAADAAPAAPDLLGTVRLPLPAIEGLARPIEETTAPLPVVAPEPPSPAATHEIPAPAVAAPESETHEDATVLSLRRPPLPEEPAPRAATPVEPPTWSVAPPAAPVPPPVPAEDTLDRTASRFGRSTEVAPPPDVSGPGLAFLGGRAGRATADPAHEEAKRLARLLISEIRLYNEEQVLEGRRHRDLYHRLKDDIDRSRQIFEERVDPAVRANADYFQQELVRSLAGGDARALGI